MALTEQAARIGHRRNGVQKESAVTGVLTESLVRVGSTVLRSYYMPETAAQLTTNTAADSPVVLAGSEIDTRPFTLVSYSFRVTLKSAIVYVYAANKADWSDELQINGWTLAVGLHQKSTGIYTTQLTPAKRYHRIKIRDAVAGQHASVSATMFARFLVE